MSRQAWPPSEDSVKATQKDFARGLPKAVGQSSIFYFCGPDEAGASAAAAKVIEALPEAGEKVEISGGDLKRDPAMLGDEARSGSLFGDTRHLLIRATGDEAHDAVKALIETAEAGAGDAAPVLIVATSATDKSRTAKLLEKRKDALVAMFYPPDLMSVAASVRAMGDAVGLRLGGDLAERIARAAGLDVRLAIGEYLARELGNAAFEPPELMRRMVADGKLGKGGSGVGDVWFRHGLGQPTAGEQFT